MNTFRNLLRTWTIFFMNQNKKDHAGTWPKGKENELLGSCLQLQLYHLEKEKSKMEKNDRAEMNIWTARSALELLRYKILVQIGQGTLPMLTFEDINEVLIVANLPVIVPGEINKKKLEVVE